MVVVIRPVKDSAVLRLWRKSAPDSSPGIGGRYTPSWSPNISDICLLSTDKYTNTKDSSPGIGGWYTPWLNRLLRKDSPKEYALVFKRLQLRLRVILPPLDMGLISTADAHRRFASHTQPVEAMWKPPLVCVMNNVKYVQILKQLQIYFFHHSQVVSACSWWLRWLMNQLCLETLKECKGSW